MPSRYLDPFLSRKGEDPTCFGSAADACTRIAAAGSSVQVVECVAEALRTLTGVDAALVSFDDASATAASPSSELGASLAQLRAPRTRKLLRSATTSQSWALEQLGPDAVLFVLPSGPCHVGAVFLLHAAVGLPAEQLDASLLRQLAQCAAMTLSHQALERALRQQVEQLQQARRDQDTFVGAMSHDLRSPLNALLGWTRLLRNGSLSNEQCTKALETVERNASAQAALLDEMLDFSRAQSDSLPLELSEVSLSQLVASIVEQAEPVAEAQGLDLSALIDPCPSPLRGDPERLRQIIKRLLNNALRFTPRGGRVRVMLSYDDGIELVIDDSGRGLSHEQRTVLFHGPKPGSRGFGSLGLRVARHVIERHGGSIDAQSDGPGQGTRVTVRLPLDGLATLTGGSAEPESPSLPATDASTSRPMTEPPSSRMQLRPPTSLISSPNWLVGLRVLVVEDEPDAREMLVSLLSHGRAEVRSATSVAEALALLDTQLPDVIISDIGMPGEDGYSLLRKVRARPVSHGGAVPAVALTAFTRGEDRARALGCGYQEHLAKPADPHALFLALASVTGRAQSNAG